MADLPARLVSETILCSVSEPWVSEGSSSKVSAQDCFLVFMEIHELLIRFSPAVFKFLENLILIIKINFTVLVLFCVRSIPFYQSAWLGVL